jgi:hypothetical protein
MEDSVTEPLHKVAQKYGSDLFNPEPQPIPKEDSDKGSVPAAKKSENAELPDFEPDFGLIEDDKIKTNKLKDKIKTVKTFEGLKALNLERLTSDLKAVVVDKAHQFINEVNDNKFRRVEDKIEEMIEIYKFSDKFDDKTAKESIRKLKELKRELLHNK